MTTLSDHLTAIELRTNNETLITFQTRDDVRNLLGAIRIMVTELGLMEQQKMPCFLMPKVASEAIASAEKFFTN